MTFRLFEKIDNISAPEGTIRTTEKRTYDDPRGLKIAETLRKHSNLDRSLDNPFRQLLLNLQFWFLDSFPFDLVNNVY